jgi:hypothetical protein
MVESSWSRLIVDLAPVSRLAASTCLFCMSFGPISSLTGTPYSLVLDYKYMNVNRTDLLLPIVEFPTWKIGVS